MRHIFTLTILLVSLTATARIAEAQPVFANGIVIEGGTLDATGAPGANQGRFGFFSDLYYDPAHNKWWALSDRGPGGGTLSYETRLQASPSTCIRSPGASASSGSRKPSSSPIRTGCWIRAPAGSISTD